MEVYSTIHGHDISFARHCNDSNRNEEIIQFLKNPLARFFVNCHSGVWGPLMHFWSDSFYTEHIFSFPDA